MKTLIVEDSSTLCAIYEAYLDDTGYEALNRSQLSLSVTESDFILPG